MEFVILIIFTVFTIMCIFLCAFCFIIGFKVGLHKAEPDKHKLPDVNISNLINKIKKPHEPVAETINEKEKKNTFFA